MAKKNHKEWSQMAIEEILAPNKKGAIISQGWSPQCEKDPSLSEDDWGVLKTTAIQAGFFLEKENKKLPPHLEPKPQHEVQKGDILITCAGPRNRCGIPCLVRKTRKKLMLSGKMYRFRINEKIAIPEFVEAYLLSQNAWKEIDKMKTGISDSGLNLTHSRFKKLLIPIPSVHTQQAIISKIEELFSELDKGIENLRLAQQQLKTYRQSVLKCAFEGKLTEQWRNEKQKLVNGNAFVKQLSNEREQQQKVRKIRLKPIPSIDEDELVELPKLPNEFAWVRLGNLLWSVKDGPHYSPKYQSTGIPFISGGNIRQTGIDFSKAKFISEELHKEISKRCKPEKGDVLYTKGGTTGIARVNTYDIDFNVWVHVAVLKTLESVNPFYLEHALNSTHCYKQSQKYTHGVGNQDLGLTRMILITLPICSYDEQVAIVEAIDSRISLANKMEESITQSLQQAEALRQSILKQAFEGRLNI